MESSEKAKKRLEVILKVQSGHLTATAGAEQLGVSRKTYYEWEARALAGMMEALTDREGGRPSKPIDSEKESMKQQIEEMKLELELRAKAKVLQKFLDDYELRQKSPSPGSGTSAKKKPKPKKR